MTTIPSGLALSHDALPIGIAGFTNEDSERIRDVISASLAPNTRRSYATQWRNFEHWAQERGASILPAQPEIVAAYLVDRADIGRKVSSIRAAGAAIAAAHRTMGFPSPTKNETLRMAIRGITRQYAAPQSQAGALTDYALAAIRATAHRQRGRETASRAASRGIADVALAQIASDSGLRRSEISNLVWDDIKRWDDGSGRIHVRRSKTDQTGEGAVVYATPRTMQDLDNLRLDSSQRGLPTGDDAPVFVGRRFRPLSESQICRRLAATAFAAGLGRGYSGHSGRVGLARRMTARGAPIDATMRQGRWRSPAMVARYTRGETAGAVAQWLGG